MAIGLRQPPADLIQQVDGTVVPEGQLSFWYVGGAGFILKSPTTTIYIDPFCGPSVDENFARLLAPPFDPNFIGVCDLIMSTHEHIDHCDPVALVPMITSTTATFVGPQSSVDSAKGFGWPDGRLKTLNWGDSLTVGDIKISAIKSVDPIAKGCNGYVFESQGLVYVNMGDTLWYDEIGEQLAGWDVDAISVSVALNPPGQTWYMSEIDAARIARDVKAKVLIPQHWDLWKWVALDPMRIALVTPLYSPETRVCPVRYGEKMTMIKAGSKGVAIV